MDEPEQIILQHDSNLNLNQLYSTNFYFKISLFRMQDAISQQDRLAIRQAPLKPETPRFSLKTYKLLILLIICSKCNAACSYWVEAIEFHL